MADRMLNTTDHIRYLLYGGTKRLNTRINSFICLFFLTFCFTVSFFFMPSPFYLTSSPRSVALELEVIFTITFSPIW